MHAIILCGGRGTRAHPLTVDVPKPLLPVAGRPVLEHLIEVFTRQGVTSFVLAAGFRVEAVGAFAKTLPHDVTVLDTGLESGTGTRVSRCLEQVGDTFLVTYGDGLGNVVVADLLQRHHEHGRGATITTVPLPSQYGTLDLGSHDVVQGFHEKPVLRDHWINAGFFAFDKDAYARHAGADLERETLPALAAAGCLAAYRHQGFWMSMDTQKDQLALDALAAGGDPPWTS